MNGISPSYLTIRDWSFTGGGPITQADLEAGARVAIIGETIVENLYDPGEEPVGSTIRIKNVPFRVVGVLSAKGQSAQGTDQDDVIFIPFYHGGAKACRNIIFGERRGNFCVYQPA